MAPNLSGSDPLAELGLAGVDSILSNVAGVHLRMALEGSQVVDHLAGAVVYRWNRPPAACVVLSGLLREFTSVPNARRITLGYEARGDLVGSVFSELPVGEGGWETLVPSSLLRLDVGVVGLVARHDPGLAWALAEDMALKVDRARTSLSHLVLSPVKARVAQQILRRAMVAGHANEGAEVSMSVGHLAEAAGTRSDIAARVVRRLGRDGILQLDHDGPLVIRDPERLVAVAEGSRPPASRRRRPNARRSRRLDR